MTKEKRDQQGTAQEETPLFIEFKKLQRVLSKHDVRLGQAYLNLSGCVARYDTFRETLTAKKFKEYGLLEALNGVRKELNDFRHLTDAERREIDVPLKAIEAEYTRILETFEKKEADHSKTSDNHSSNSPKRM